MKGSWGEFVIALLFSVGGFVNVQASAQALVEEYKSLTWTPVSAVVLASEVEFDQRLRIKYSPHIVYAYEVGGRAFEGSRIRVKDFSAGQDSSRKVVEQYPVGTKQTIYVDPGDATKAVLQPGLNASTVGWLGVAVVLTMLGIGMFTFAIRARARARNA